MEVDWTKQHCGVHQAPFDEMLTLMPDIIPVIETFPDNGRDFTWDVKVHMLMPRQYACMPNWHADFVPRVNGIQRYDKVDLNWPMYMWLSGGPLTQFKNGYINAKTWHRFNQLDEHRGTAAGDFCWRAFIRAVHKNILKPKEGPWGRRHTQVYVDEDSFQW